MRPFDSMAFGRRRVDVIGAGATGSHLVPELARLRVMNLHVWDFDVVAEHNIRNQTYGLHQVGMQKVEALRDNVNRDTGRSIHVYDRPCDGLITLGEVVFLLTDTMESRRLIWENGIRYQPQVRLMIETRMGFDVGRVYAVDPNEPEQVEAWEKTLVDRSGRERVETACGTVPVVGATAATLAGFAVWQFLRWFAIEQGGEDELEHELIYAHRPVSMLSRRFDASGVMVNGVTVRP